MPKTAEDAADASDDPMDVPDVLETGNFTQKLVQTRADVASTRAGVLGDLGSLWRPQKLHKVE